VCDDKVVCCDHTCIVVRAGGGGVLDDLNDELAQIVKAAAPSVVEISGGGGKVAATLPAAVTGQPPQGQCTKALQDACRNACSVGRSGFVIDAAGYILTTSDVARSDKVTVKFSDGTQAEGKVVGRDELIDVAVIKVDKTGLKPLPLGNSDGLQVGNLVVSVNNQAGMESSVSLGVVAGLNRQMDQAQD